MKKNYYPVKTLALQLLWIVLLLSPSLSRSQNVVQEKTLHLGDAAEILWHDGESKWRKSMITALSTDEATFDHFLTHNQTAWFKDRGDFFNGILEGNIGDDGAVVYFSNLQKKYTGFWNEQSKELNDADLAKAPLPHPPIVQNACNPSCYNISFQDGTLKGWSAYYAVNSSTTAAASLTSKTGGLCGSITQAGGPNPNTGSTYHVQLMPATGNDVIAGGLVPYKPPMGGRSVMIGDGPNITYGAGILEQTYLVDPSAPILTVQYAVLLENPGHTGFEQPWFKVEVLDQNGAPIPGCGQYFVVAAGNLPGFKAIPYGAGTVYCRPWTTAFVPLYNYMGQCITVRFTAADCGQGGHFGYAYVAATCEKLDLIPSSIGFCIGQQSATIKGPLGDPSTTYQWSSVGGCISAPSNQQTVKVTCPGTYSLVMTSGGNCIDTFSIPLPAIPFGPPPVACFSANKVCSGKPTTFNGLCSNPNTNVKYYWDFYNSGNFDDSSGAAPTWVYSSGGVYPVRLHVQDTSGCGMDTTINVIVDSTYTGTMPTVTIATTNVSACGQCNATIIVTIKSTNGNSVVTNDFNTRKWTAGGSSTGTGWTSSSTSISIINNFYTSKITYTGVCAGSYNFFFNPVVSVNPSPCNAGGVLYDTIPIFIGAAGVNITANITSTAASCGNNNGTATLNGIGGTPGYTYSWKTPNLGSGATKTGLAPGTYTVEIKDAAGCLGVSKVVIGNFSQLSAQVVPFDATCFGANDGSIKVTPLAGLIPFTYSWSGNVSTTDSAGALAPGTYTIYMTDAGGCTGNVTAVIKQPTEVIAAITSCTCSVNCGQTGSSSATASGGYGPYSYKWNTTGAITPSVTGLPAGPSMVVVTDAFGCKDSVQVTVTVNNGPQVQTVPSAPICIGAIANLGANTATGVTYTWSPAPVGGCASCLNTTTSPTTTTKYTLTVADITGCSTVDSVTVTVNPLPTITVTPPSAVCIGNNVTLTSGGAAAYAWSNGQSGIGLTSITVIPTVGSNNYTVTGIDANGCINVANTSIAVNPLPIVTITPPDSICLGASTTITASGGVGYAWSTGQSGIGLSSIAITTPPVGVTTYTVTAVDANGCINTNNTSLTVTQITLSISPPVSLCPGSSTQLTSAGGTIFSWTPPGSGLSCYNCFNPVATPPATTTYTVGITDANGCIGSTSVTVTINPQLTVLMSPDPTICVGKSAPIAVIASGGTTYSYTWTPGISAGLNDSTIQNPVATPLTTTTYSVEVNDVNGCQGSSQVTVTVNQLPVVTAALNAPICFGASVQLSAFGASSYTWSTGQSGVGLSNITITPQVGTFNFTVTGTDVNGCVNTATTSIVVNSLPLILISPPDSICIGGSRQLTASGGNNYVWSNGQSGATITVTPALGLNNYSVSVTDINGCAGTNSATIFVDQPPTATASGIPICFGQTSQLNASGGLHYTWTPALYLSDPYIPNPVVTPADSITYSYTVEVKNTALCPAAYATATVAVSPIPTVKASSDTSIIAGMSAQLTSVGNGLLYNWSPSVGLSCTNCPNPLASPMQSTIYIVTTSDQYGCVNADTVLIIVDDVLTLYVPTAFTPYNYDDTNNMFYAYGVGIWQFEFYIYDRWGSLIFQTTDPSIGWDGSYKGQMVQSDVYTWLARAVSITGKTISKTGPVTVVH